MMIKKQSRIGRIYIKLVTKSLFFFPVFVFSGVALILFLTINTKVDVIKTYQVSVINYNSDYALIIDDNINDNLNSESLDKIFIYEDKNEAVYQIKDIHNITDSVSDAEVDRTYLTFDMASDNAQELKEFLEAHVGMEIKADIPVRKISLLERIFKRGGIED